MMFFSAPRQLTAACIGLLLMGPVLSAAAQSPRSGAETHCSLTPLDPARRSQQAALVVEGEVLSADGFWDAAHRRIYTRHRVRVFSTFKGEAPAELIVLTEGGTVGTDWQELTNTLRLQVGDQGVLFLQPAAGITAEAGWLAYGSQQGFIRYDLATLSAAEPFQTYPAIDKTFYTTLSAQTGQPRRIMGANQRLETARQRLAQPAAAAKGQAPTIASLTPATITAGTGAVLTIVGSGFGNTQGTGFVEFRNADDGGSTFIQPQVADYVSWTDTQIQVRVPSFSLSGNPAGTGPVRVTTADKLQATSSRTIVVTYALSNVQDRASKEVVRPRHSNQNGSGGLTFQQETGFASNTNASQILRRGLLETWRCQTGVNWTLGSNRSGHGAADDGENSVGFDVGAELPAGILGRTTNYYRGCYGPRGELVFYVKEIDMQFDDGINFQFGPGFPTAVQYDFESVLVHELGHAQQLGHVILEAAVMHYGVRAAQVKRSLGAADLTGAHLVLRTRSFLAPDCGPGPMLPAPLTSTAARRQGGTAEITWTTRDECAVQQFVVERSADTTAWQPVGTVAAGASTQSYRFLDPQPLPQLSYYRVRVERPDNSLDTAAPLPVSADAAAAGHLVVFPNPIQNGLLRLQFPSAATGTLSVFLYDALGQYYRGQALNVEPGLNIRSLNVDNLRPGWYVLRWRDSAGNRGATPFVRVQ
ncbi:IPT/TIG domain-containing protein [Hymenobacter persicinus]|uniref:IPT/TIG domain-containing protein n=1 Tax=Hymenobacter persicinus TaxID=2025506 RepID=A0A4Q5LC54_9BACT|nr:IPT/TIG domain-containing protein [Hymenobacter persicinus]RYU80129.1 hypothetical protein EWM57_09310 [Hymenobacter persicinus]